MIKETIKGALFGVSILTSTMTHAYLPPVFFEANKDYYADLVSPDPSTLQVVAFHGINDCGYSLEQLRVAITEETAKHKIQPTFVNRGDLKNGKLALFVTSSCRTFYGEESLELSVRFGDPRTKPEKVWAKEYGLSHAIGGQDRLDSVVRESVHGAIYHYNSPNNLPKPFSH